MADKRLPDRVGWIGTGRMGSALAERLLAEGVDLWVYNRTRAKAEPLAELGAKVVDSPAELAGRDIVFTMVAGPQDVMEVAFGPEGVLAQQDARPSVLVDSTTIDTGTSRSLTEKAAEVGTAVLAAPVSGNPKVVRAGKLTTVVSGPPDSYEKVSPYLECFGRKVTYVGEGDEARLVKICHNLMLGVVAQCMAEITVLAEKGGMSRAAFLDFLNNSVMGSMFTRYKTPAYVNLDFTPTFTPLLLRKDFDLGFEAARELDVPMPVAAAAQQMIQALIGSGHTDEDFAALLEHQARASGLDLQSENADIDEGLVVR
jgi:3-hydroxyisobutyrate dehydrogenase